MLDFHNRNDTDEILW